MKKVKNLEELIKFKMVTHMDVNQNLEIPQISHDSINLGTSVFQPSISSQQHNSDHKLGGGSHKFASSSNKRPGQPSKAMHSSVNYD